MSNTTIILIAVIVNIILYMAPKLETYLFEKHLQEMKDGKRPWS